MARWGAGSRPSLIPPSPTVGQLWPRLPARPSPPPAAAGTEAGRYSRDADLKQVVLDQLLAQHDDAELDAELHEAAPWGTLQWGEERRRSDHVPLREARAWISYAVVEQEGLGVRGAVCTYLFHAVTIKHIDIASRPTHKPEIKT